MKNNPAPIDPRFQALLQRLPRRDQTLYRDLKYAKCVKTRVGETFVLYTYEENKPVELERLRVKGFSCNHETGVSIQLATNDEETVDIGVSPARLFNYDVFLHSPLSPHLSWQPAEQENDQGFLVFPLVIKCHNKPSFQLKLGDYFDTEDVFNYEVYQANLRG